MTNKTRLDRRKARRAAEIRAHFLGQVARLAVAVSGIGLAIAASGLLAIVPLIENEAASAALSVAGVIMFPCSTAGAIGGAVAFLENLKG